MSGGLFPNVTNRLFAPGFRLSRVDVAVLFAGAVAAVSLATTDVWAGVAVGFVVGHFFLFCNVLRMSRPLELTWAGVFMGLAVGAMVWGVVSWPVVFGIS